MGTSVEVPHDRVFQFEGFSLDMTRRVLRNGDREVELRPKSFDVLCCLVQHGGQLATKDELLRSAWPGVTVSDDLLARCVSDIRRSLDDRDQRIVKTVPVRGYLLAASVPSCRPTAGSQRRSRPRPDCPTGRRSPCCRSTI